MDALALTFDDGPDGRFTPVLLDTLAEHGALATFFVIASHAAAAPNLIDRMLTSGHCVGLHCDAHVRHSERGRSWVEADTEHALARLAELGVAPSLWRTPWGDTAPWTQSIAERHGLRLVGWSVDTHDWRGDDAGTMFSIARSRLLPGAIVLAHDGIGPGALRHDVCETVAFVRLVAGYAERHQLRLRALV